MYAIAICVLKINGNGKVDFRCHDNNIVFEIYLQNSLLITTNPPTLPHWEKNNKKIFTKYLTLAKTDYKLNKTNEDVFAGKGK